MPRPDLAERVARVAAAALAARKVVTPLELLLGLGWLPSSTANQWRQGRVDCLEGVMQVNPQTISTALQLLRKWAEKHGLQPSETTYVARTPDRRPLRFSSSGDPALERAYRTHWMSPELSERERQRRAEKENRPPDLVVIQPSHPDWTCAACGGSGDLLTMEERGPICMRCARLDHLVFLASGDAKLTRRAHQASTLSAVVVRFSRTRKRYERQGLLVEPEALAAAEREGSAAAGSQTPRSRTR